MDDKTPGTMKIASDIIVAALESKSLTLQPDPRVRERSYEHDLSQIARAFTVIHDAVYNEFRRISAQKQA